jgi:hypothetical protein
VYFSLSSPVVVEQIGMLEICMQVLYQAESLFPACMETSNQELRLF